MDRFTALIQVRTSYLPHEILWGYQFRHNCVQFDSEEQKYEVSFDSFNDIVKDDTPRQDISNMLIKFTVILKSFLFRFSPKVFYTSKKGKS